MGYDEIQNTLAFNRGSDARIIGSAMGGNPYKNIDSKHASWRAGWLDVDENWGEWVEGRWDIKKLPDIVECKEEEIISEERYQKIYEECDSILKNADEQKKSAGVPSDFICRHVTNGRAT